MKDLKRRHKLFVSPAIQGRLLTRLCFYWFAYHLVLWHAMFAYYYLRVTVGLTAQPNGTLFDLYGRFVLENRALAFCALSVTPLLLWDALQVTHRFVGPVVRIQNVLKQLTRGEKVAPITLRKGDFLTELRDALNDYLKVSGNLISRPPSTDCPPQSTDASCEELLLADVQQLQDLDGTGADPNKHSEPADAVRG